MTGDWIQLLLSTLFGVSTLLGVLTLGHRAVRLVVGSHPVDALASADWRSTFASIVPLDSLLAPALADAPTLPRADVTRRRRAAALPPPAFGPRPPAVVGT